MDRLIFFSLLALLVFTQLAFAGVHDWAYTFMEMGLFLLAALAVGSSLVDSIAGRPGRADCWGLRARGAFPVAAAFTNPVFLLLVALLGLAALQLMPLPAGVLGLLSPRILDLKAKALNLTAAGPASWLPLSLIPYLTRLELLKILGYAAMLFLVLTRVDTRKRQRILCWTVIGMGLFQVLYGMVQTYGGEPKIWWWRNQFGGSLSGTYINRNHLAGFLELAIPLCLGLGFAEWQKRRSGAGGSGSGSRGPREIDPAEEGWESSALPFGHRRRLKRGGGRLTTTWRKKLRARLLATEAVAWPLAMVFMAVVMGVGLLLTASRGGILSLSFSLLLMAMLFALRPKERRLGLAILAIGLVILIYGLNVGLEKTVQRFGAMESGFAERMEVYRSAWPMVGDYPVAGSGLGTFADGFAAYAPPREVSSYVRDYAHNDWLQLIIETGIVGWTVVLAGSIWFMVATIRQWLRRRDPLAVGLGAGAITGLFSLALHSFVDFNLNIPANGLAAVVTAGLGWQALFAGKGGLEQRASGVNSDRQVRRLAGAAVLSTGVLVVLGFAAHASVTHFRAEVQCSTRPNSTLHRDKNPPEHEVRTAIALDPANPAYHSRLARHLGGRVAGQEQGSILRARLQEEMLAAWGEALRHNPLKAEYWYRYGSILAAIPGGEDRLARADEAMRTAMALRPNDPRLLLRLGRYWSLRSGVGAAADREAARGQMELVLRHALAISPGSWQRVAALVWAQSPDPAILAALVPETRPELAARFGQWAASR